MTFGVSGVALGGTALFAEGHRSLTLAGAILSTALEPAMAVAATAWASKPTRPTRLWGPDGAGGLLARGGILSAQEQPGIAGPKSGFTQVSTLPSPPCSYT